MSGRWASFVRRYGWRAYALPVLIVVTVAALVHGTTGASKPAHGTPAAGRHGGTSSGPDTGSSGSGPAHLEGLTGGDTDFRPGATPPPVVIHLKTDATTSCSDNSYAQLLLVSISAQHMWACEGTHEVRSTAVTTGKVADDDQTPLGSWRVQAKQRDRYLVGPGYKDFVHYWVPFNGDFGLHDAPWQTMPFGSSDWRTKGSHGCVHVPSATMAWLYGWAAVGDTVVTVTS